MGFLKKITRPISRVLDKVIPNEIKPALPFLAAAAPFMAPGLMSLGGNTMLSRALISGGLNLGSQLAQEGSEGEFSGLSTLMAAATGALSGGGPGKAIGVDSPAANNALVRSDATGASKFFADKAAGMQPGFAKSGLGALEGTSNYLTGVGETLRNNPFSMEGLKAAMVPVGQGITDLAVAENRRAMKDYEREQAEYEARMDEEDANRAFAIRQSMEAYGFTEQEILDAIEAAGYRAGGRVGLSMGGDPDFSGIKGAVESVDENMMADRSGDFFRLREEAIQKGDDDKIKEIESDFFREFGMVMPKMAKDGGRIGLQQGGVLAQILPQASQRPLLAGLQPLRQAEAVFPRLNQLEQGVGRAEETLGRIRSRLGPEQKGTLASFQPMLQPALGYQPLNMLSLNRGMGISALQSGPEAQGMKDGGMMDLEARV